jgi:cytosine/adenosine deaminase-related metal-dependent hydrolase
MGIVSGGWMMARAALVAQGKIAAGQDNNGDPFYPAKIATAHFYAEHAMSEAAGLAQEVVQGGASALALDEAMF